MMSAAAAAAITGVCATASAQVLVEIEGPFSAYTSLTPNSGEMSVMNNVVVVDAATEFISPTGSRSSILRPNGNPLFTVNQWLRGSTYDGRRRPGLLGGTVIVTGEFDLATGKVIASEVFSDVAENVILGAITDNVCTTAQCDGPGDFIRGNNGPVFIPNKDPRLMALPITDAGLFKVDLTNKNLVGPPGAPTTFGGEGYFSDDKIFPSLENPQEQALVYWAFEMGENRPDLLATPLVPEISSLRIRCTEGGRLEVRGFVHAPVNADGSPAGGAGMPLTGGAGTIRVTMDFNRDGILQANETINGGAPTADVPATYGVYRVRQDVTVCGTSANVYWDRPGGAGTPWASVLNVPVDRLREE